MHFRTFHSHLHYSQSCNFDLKGKMQGRMEGVAYEN
jgi:hypothetical protein